MLGKGLRSNWLRGVLSNDSTGMTAIVVLRFNVEQSRQRRACPAARGAAMHLPSKVAAIVPELCGASVRIVSQHPHSRGAISRPGFASSLSLGKRRAQGMPGARRTHCLACKTKKTHEANTGTPKSLRHSLRNGFTASPRSPWCTGLFSHRRPRDCRNASSTNLTPASGRQDHTA